MPTNLPASEGPPLLRIRGLTVAFPGPDQGWRPVVRDLSFDVARGETVAVVGESGCGKTMTTLAIMGLLPPEATIRGGSMTLGVDTLADAKATAETVELVGLPETAWRTLRGRRVAMIFQDPASALNPVLSLGSQLTEAIRQHRRTGRGAARRQALDLLERVAMPDPAQRLSAYPHHLSGGQQQRAMIALALASEPELLLADEPTTALDVTLQAQILALLHELRRAMSLSVVLVTHDLGAVANVSDRMLVMYAGALVEQGPTAEVYAHPAHPYTRALIDARPRLGAPRSSRLVLSGRVPAAGHLPAGCAFAPRCPSVLPHCHGTPPPIVPLDARRTSCCHLHEPAPGSA